MKRFFTRRQDRELGLFGNIIEVAKPMLARTVTMEPYLQPQPGEHNPSLNITIDEAEGLRATLPYDVEVKTAAGQPIHGNPTRYRFGLVVDAPLRVGWAKVGEPLLVHSFQETWTILSDVRQYISEEIQELEMELAWGLVEEEGEESDEGEEDQFGPLEDDFYDPAEDQDAVGSGPFDRDPMGW